MKKILLKYSSKLLKIIATKPKLSKKFYNKKNWFLVFLFKNNFDLYLLIVAWSIHNRYNSIAHTLLSERVFNNLAKDVDLKGALLVLDTKLSNYSNEFYIIPKFRHMNSLTKYLRLLYRSRLDDIAFYVARDNNFISSDLCKNYFKSIYRDSDEIFVENANMSQVEVYINSLLENHQFYTFQYFSKTVTDKKIRDLMQIYINKCSYHTGIDNNLIPEKILKTTVIDLRGSKNQYKTIINFLINTTESEKNHYKFYIDDFIRTPLPNVNLIFEVILK